MAVASGDSTLATGSSSGKGWNIIPLDDEEKYVRQLLPKFLPRGACHIYVTPTSNFKHQFARAKTMLANSGDFIVIHGLGMAAEKGINLTLEMKNSVPGLILSTNTSSFHVNEDLALVVTGDRQTRSVSVVHMKLMKPRKDDSDSGSKEAKDHQRS